MALGAAVSLKLAGTGVRLAAIAVLALALGACTPIYRNHGYVPSDKDLEEVVVGKSTVEDVELSVGRPSAIGVLAGSGWYYVGSRFKQVGPRAPVEIDRQVVAITFDEAGVVENVERFGMEKGEVVAISRRVTKSNVKSIGFLRQLFQSLGNFDATKAINGPRSSL
ncbi:MAG: outer membrane protein assembly factor BamE [Paracoccaceae bacterium]